MILSRQLARRRIAAGTRPGWFAAWIPVAADALALLGLMAIAFVASRGLFFGWPVWAAVTVLVLLFFIPMQIVLITSALWAARSRWTDREDAGPTA